MTFFTHEPLSCPKCGYTMDHATPGDITLCIKCASYLRFGENTLELLTPEGFGGLSRDVQRMLERTRVAILGMMPS